MPSRTVTVRVTVRLVNVETHEEISSFYARLQGTTITTEFPIRNPGACCAYEISGLRPLRVSARDFKPTTSTEEIGNKQYRLHHLEFFPV
jgi:hypothetical protein